MYNKAIIRFGFCDIQNNQGLSKGYQPQPTSTAIFLDSTKASSNNCLLLRFFEVRSFYELASIIVEHTL